MSQSQVDLPPQHMRKQKHRPQSLDLKRGSGENGDVALRIVSPGLPQLNEAMKSTVKISQQIELQQKSLIAAIHSGNSSFSSKMASDESSGDDDDDSYGHSDSAGEAEKQTTSSTIVTVPLEDKLDESAGTGDSKRKSEDDQNDELLTPTVKRLKRKHTPASLNIAATKNTSNPMLAIKSAPIRQTKIQSAVPRQISGSYKKAHMPYASVHPGTGAMPAPVMYQVVSHMPVQRRGYGPYIQTPLMYQAVPVAQATQTYPVGRRPRPYTTTTSQFPRGTKAFASNAGHASSQNTSSQQNTSKNTNQVRDIYHGDYTRDAPLRSQPLSSQKDFFDLAKSKRRLEEDRMPVSEDEIKEMEAKYRTLNDEQNASNRSPGDTAIFGSINLMNESVFNFKIFKKPQSSSASSTERQMVSPEPTSALSKDSSASKPKQSPDTVTDTNMSQNGSAASSPDLISRLNSEKQKFLKICETSWDEFFGPKKPKPSGSS